MREELGHSRKAKYRRRRQPDGADACWLARLEPSHASLQGGTGRRDRDCHQGSRRWCRDCTGQAAHGHHDGPRLNEPRYASLPNIMKAKKKPLEKKSLADYGIDMSKRLQTVKVAEPPARQGGGKVENVDGLVGKLKELGAM